MPQDYPDWQRPTVFVDQVVAVFDAAKWFSNQGSQVFVWAAVEVVQNLATVLASRTVPSGKVMQIVGSAYIIRAPTATPRSTEGNVTIDFQGVASYAHGIGGGMSFDTPLRATAGQIIRLYVAQWGSGATMDMVGGFWGYDEDA